MAYTLNSTIREIMADERAKAVVDKHLPGASTHPQLAEVLDMTVQEISYYPEAGLTPQKLAAIAADFEKL